MYVCMYIYLYTHDSHDIHIYIYTYIEPYNIDIVAKLPSLGY